MWLRKSCGTAEKMLASKQKGEIKEETGEVSGEGTAEPFPSQLCVSTSIAFNGIRIPLEISEAVNEHDQEISMEG